ncbi:hypothetical protein ASE68_03165 [Agromyces sp. Leaf222]|nr:hypothetical protein ASE68_03165 [Agromyces sp. Leaf222]
MMMTDEYLIEVDVEREGVWTVRTESGSSYQFTVAAERTMMRRQPAVFTRYLERRSLHADGTEITCVIASLKLGHDGVVFFRRDENAPLTTRKTTKIEEIFWAQFDPDFEEGTRHDWWGGVRLDAFLAGLDDTLLVSEAIAADVTAGELHQRFIRAHRRGLWTYEDRFVQDAFLPGYLVPGIFTQTTYWVDIFGRIRKIADPTFTMADILTATSQIHRAAPTLLEKADKFGYPRAAGQSATAWLREMPVMRALREALVR